MPTSNQSGSQAAVVGTEQQLGAAITAGGTYVLVVDTSNMVNGDVIELRAKTKAKAGSTSRLAYMVTYAHVQAELNKYSVPIPVDVEILFTLKQTAGVGRSFDWNILSL
jgi:outer membrane protein W